MGNGGSNISKILHGILFFILLFFLIKPLMTTSLLIVDWARKWMLKIVRRSSIDMDNIKLIALDMDGTLLNSEDKVSDYTKNVIEKALANDVHVVLSTGRWLKSCYPYAEELKLDSNLVTGNGDNEGAS